MLFGIDCATKISNKQESATLILYTHSNLDFMFIQAFRRPPLTKNAIVLICFVSQKSKNKLLGRDGSSE